LGAIERLAFLTIIFIHLFASPRLLFPALCFHSPSTVIPSEARNLALTSSPADQNVIPCRHENSESGPPHPARASR
jgi:hypothetical protein